METNKPLSHKAFKSFCMHRHDIVVNQHYPEDSNIPYSFHLLAVAAQAKKFMNLVSFKDVLVVIRSAYGHDLIEDARMSYNDVLRISDKKTADVIFLCSEYTGKTRAERKPDEFYAALVENELAVFVKLCDIAANNIYTALQSDRAKLVTKREEWFKISNKLSPIYFEKYKSLFLYIDNIVNL